MRGARLVRLFLDCVAVSGRAEIVNVLIEIRAQIGAMALRGGLWLSPAAQEQKNRPHARPKARDNGHNATAQDIGHCEAKAQHNKSAASGTKGQGQQETTPQPKTSATCEAKAQPNDARDNEIGHMRGQSQRP